MRHRKLTKKGKGSVIVTLPERGGDKVVVAIGEGRQRFVVLNVPDHLLGPDLIIGPWRQFAPSDPIPGRGRSS
ncbi:hypothetical protein Syun_009716 [Stephania yunnanensis]|uniref:Uncharacterized protein n=1 Tax=Stephania yunnanensis TaxID=152371 RepID=A0AAP0KF59_9MAGN